MVVDACRRELFNGFSQRMTYPNYRAVLFDLDGTLCDTALDFAYALNQVLKEENRPILSLSHVREQLSNGAEQAIRYAFSDIHHTEQLQRYRERFIDYYQQHLLTHTQLYPGIAQILYQLKQHQIPWGVVSNKPQAMSQAIIEQLTQAYPPTVIVGGDTLAVAKPHPEPLLFAAQQCNIAYHDCIYVGDHQRDIMAAKAAGMISVAAAFGYVQFDDNPHRWEADWVVDTPHQLCELLRLPK